MDSAELRDVEGASLLDAPGYIREQFSAEVPELEVAFATIVSELAEATKYMHGPGINLAVSNVLNQANNSFIDNLFDLLHGRGRPAAGGMRNLFELLVTAKDIVASSRQAQRYLDHRVVVAQLEAGLTVESEHLTKAERSADLHRRKTLGRDTSAAYEQALNDYGPSFRRAWSRDTLYVRAERHGLSQDYDSYRLASAVLHGSAGGDAGLRSEIKSRTVVRTGPALTICPLVYLQTFRFYQNIIESFESSLGATTVGLSAALDQGLRLWSRYRRAALRIDRRLWPDEPTPGMLAIFAFKHRGAHREWHLLDTQRDLIIEADPPRTLSEKLASNLTELIETAALESDPETLITIAVVGARVLPKPSAEWRDPLTVLPKKTPGFQMRRIPLGN
jgi:hypothetical protein